MAAGDVSLDDIAATIRMNLQVRRVDVDSSRRAGAI